MINNELTLVTQNLPRGLGSSKPQMATATCRFCFEDDDASAMISPCKCKGTSEFVHKACLDKWRSMTSKNNDTCYTCRSHYNEERGWRRFEDFIRRQREEEMRQRLEYARMQDELARLERLRQPQQQHGHSTLGHEQCIINIQCDTKNRPHS